MAKHHQGITKVNLNNKGEKMSEKIDRFHDASLLKKPAKSLKIEGSGTLSGGDGRYQIREKLLSESKDAKKQTAKHQSLSFDDRKEKMQATKDKARSIRSNPEYYNT